MFEEKEGGREGGGEGKRLGGGGGGEFIVIVSCLTLKIPFFHYPSQARLDMILSCKL